MNLDVLFEMFVSYHISQAGRPEDRGGDLTSGALGFVEATRSSDRKKHGGYQHLRDRPKRRPYLWDNQDEWLGR